MPYDNYSLTIQLYLRELPNKIYLFIAYNNEESKRKNKGEGYQIEHDKIERYCFYINKNNETGWVNNPQIKLGIPDKFDAIYLVEQGNRFVSSKVLVEECLNKLFALNMAI